METSAPLRDRPDLANPVDTEVRVHIPVRALQNVKMVADNKPHLWKDYAPSEVLSAVVTPKDACKAGRVQSPMRSSRIIRALQHIRVELRLLLPPTRDLAADVTFGTGFDCPQQAAIQSNFPGFTTQARTILNLSTVSAGTQRSDDCLILNIWSKPSNKSAENKKPVFVLFHGGRFAGDNTNTLFANGQYLVNNTDIIVVSVNYRLNIFGFPGGPNTDTNLGLRDQHNETVLSPSAYLSLASTGKFAPLPYFRGHNDNEQGYYAIPAFAQGRNVTAEQARKFLLESFVCPVSYVARARVAAGVKTWLFRYFGDWEDTRLYPGSGAYHGSELHMVLGGAEDASGLGMEKAQRDMVGVVQRA
ncbi:acetylcholinesterase precursor [Pyrenophora tritici-repentis Pt-1C-BFP]|uniref:Acetylcholinesterase n=1 Tax=Pyrenophora tritici-repentis (strain Pt-1C-BFP) TaxID=426418 RepID=B2VXG5_PYRTR|nr:acetylcholinesterase precursor [Pyrenophora tritici-repentis Pt-1C-BFP]EDU45734.1 acetylcholinesterase precursor [Pyrenophora tritici-repentis Pt-1C-BFP]